MKRFPVALSEKLEKLLFITTNLQNIDTSLFTRLDKVELTETNTVEFHFSEFGGQIIRIIGALSQISGQILWTED